tara:strand:- start:315 stop:701 length:387 start_codon:yes stop_codon:yes gene_type:complete
MERGARPPQTNGANFTFCTACSTVQLKSMVTNSPGFATARSSFENASLVLTATERARCMRAPEAGSLISSAMQHKHNDAPDAQIVPRFSELPAVCSETRSATPPEVQAAPKDRTIDEGFQAMFNSRRA